MRGFVFDGFVELDLPNAVGCRYQRRSVAEAAVLEGETNTPQKFRMLMGRVSVDHDACCLAGRCLCSPLFRRGGAIACLFVAPALNPT